MRSRGVIGVICCAVGAVWIGQGINAVHGSSMSGHGQWTAIGIAVVVIGHGLLLWAWRIRKNRTA